MCDMGYSPSVRLFEAAGCGAAIISDRWAGLESFFLPQSEIMVANSPRDVVELISNLSESQMREIGRRAQERVLAEHSAEKRAIQFEEYVNFGTLQPALRLGTEAGCGTSRASVR